MDEGARSGAVEHQWNPGQWNAASGGNQPVQAKAGPKMELKGPAASILSQFGNNQADKENAGYEPGSSNNGAKPGSRTEPHEYQPSRVPSKSALRKSLGPGAAVPSDAENAHMQKLMGQMQQLEGQMQQFSAQTQARRDSLTGRSEKYRPDAAQADRHAAALEHAEGAQQAGEGDAGPSQDDDCTAPLCKGGSKEHVVQLPAGAASSKFVKSASDIFEEAGLKKLVVDGLHKQLQRTKDGATEKSRIHELAELVKLLRKCIKELGARATLYIDQCLKLEREYVQQVEGMQLSSTTTVKQLEAEVAAARQSLAQFEHDFKSDKAAWGLDLDMQKAEVARLRRELERLTDERDRAREEGKRAEQLKQQLDAELKDLRKAASQQMREVSVNQSEAVRHLTEERTAADHRVASLKDENGKLTATLKAAQLCVQEYEMEVHMLRASCDNLKGSLAGKEASASAHLDQATKLQLDLQQCREQLGSLQAESCRLQHQLASVTQERDGLAAGVAERDTQLAELRGRLQELSTQLESERGAWEQERSSTQASLAAGNQERAALCDEKGLLKTALASALAQMETAESQAAQLGCERGELLRERTNLLHQVEFAAGCQATAEQQAAEVRSRLAQRDEELAQNKQELQEKNAKLAQLEGEFVALKEVLGETAAEAGEGKQDIVAALLSKIATLHGAVAAAEGSRRKLHNELVDLRGNIRVYCRVRPHLQPSLRCMPDGASCVLNVDGKEHNFAYDRVFGPSSSQEEVFGAVSELVQSALDGYHVCLFSYGQTGAGKTHTMQGSGNGPERGIIPRAVEKVLAAARKLEEQCEWQYSMEASFIEIYNNQMRDLLQGGTSGGSYITDLHAIKHDPDGGHTMVQGVSKVPVTGVDVAADLVRRAAAARAVEATAMNATSSRSHSVFMLYISGSHPPSGTQLQGCLCLVDLAGSERLDRSLAEGQAKKEACAINQSLSALGDVFAALASRNSHVPYRNSKLTYLLQPCLGGHGKTLMFVNINPESASAAESLCSLRFATKVGGCETGAKGGARRNVITGQQQPGGAGAGPSGANDDAGVKRMSMSGLPRAPPSAGGAAVDAAAKRMSLAGPSRLNGGAASGGADAAGGAKRMSLPGLPRPDAGGAARGTLVGQKRPAGPAAPSGAAKRSRP